LKTEVYYFSGTGNSLHVAHEINKSLIDSGRVLALARYVNESTISTDADLIGIIFPVYMGDTPWVVKDFLRRLRIQTCTYVFSVATYNSHAANVMPTLAGYLKTFSIDLSLGELINMPGNAINSTKKENEERLTASVKRINDIVIKINSRIVEPHFISARIEKKAASYRKKPNSSFTRYKLLEACNGCRTCKKVCPMANIEMENKRPLWGMNCAACLACFHWCPQNAIKWGMPIVGNRPQYHHPDITVNDIAEHQFKERFDAVG